MNRMGITVTTVCGLEELDSHGERGVTHVLSLLDPECPEPQGFAGYGTHDRVTLHFHDVIEPREGMVPPTREDVAAIVEYGRALEADGALRADGHLLVHCHMGISRSTAAMVILLAYAFPGRPEDALFEELRTIRPQAWPNSLMIEFADDLLGRDGRLVAALARHYALRLRGQPEVADWMTRHGRGREVDMGRAPPTAP